MHAINVLVLAASLFSSLHLACPIVERDLAEATNATIEARQACPQYDYAQKGTNWASQCGAWAKCGNGKQQSPINLPANNFASTHRPVFGFPGGNNVRGEIFNRRFGPEWVPLTGAQVPTLRFDGVTYTLLQWHTHTPSSEHAFGGNKQNAEIHFVFGTNNVPKAVAGIGIQYGQGAAFFNSIFDQLDQQGNNLPNVGSTDRFVVAPDFQNILSSTHFRDYWTYRGSLTTPDCGEGIRWFLGGWTTTLSGSQFPRLNEASIDSVRALQTVTSEHQINV